VLAANTAIVHDTRMTTTLLPAQANGCKIGRVYLPVTNLKDAVRVWEQHRDFHNLGASESPSVTACIDKKLYRISYNGRVWDSATGAEVIQDN
jgi:hypothetical protein